MTNVTLERTAPTQNAPATYMPQAQGQAADRRIKEKAPADAPAKMGVRNTQVLRTDARRLDEFFSFDQVLLDAPCTGTGTVRAGDERAGKRITPQLLAKVTKSQAALLDRGLTVLKPGCTLIYSTCSILPAENEDIVRAALKRHKDCELAPIALPDSALEAIPRLPCRLEEGALTVRPTRLFEGFFLAAIKKQARARR